MSGLAGLMHSRGWQNKVCVFTFQCSEQAFIQVVDVLKVLPNLPETRTSTLLETIIAIIFAPVLLVFVCHCAPFLHKNSSSLGFSKVLCLGRRSEKTQNVKWLKHQIFACESLPQNFGPKRKQEPLAAIRGR